MQHTHQVTDDVDSEISSQRCFGIIRFGKIRSLVAHAAHGRKKVAIGLWRQKQRSEVQEKTISGHDAKQTSQNVGKDSMKSESV